MLFDLQLQNTQTSEFPVLLSVSFFSSIVQYVVWSSDTEDPNKYRALKHQTLSTVIFLFFIPIVQCVCVIYRNMVPEHQTSRTVILYLSFLSVFQYVCVSFRQMRLKHQIFRTTIFHFAFSLLLSTLLWTWDPLHSSLHSDRNTVLSYLLCSFYVRQCDRYILDSSITLVESPHSLLFLFLYNEVRVSDLRCILYSDIATVESRSLCFLFLSIWLRACDLVNFVLNH